MFVNDIETLFPLQQRENHADKRQRDALSEKVQIMTAIGASS